MMKTNLALYIHIPFCEQKCNYCDFNSGVYSKTIKEKYVDSLIKEINRESSYYKDYSVDTIYIGGGTPSSLEGEDVYSIIKNLKNNFNISSNLEFTIEANPNSVKVDKLYFYKEAGINRLSLGVQSFIDKELNALGRIHNREDIYKAIENIKIVGLDNISLDLIFGIPFQSLESLKESLEEAISMGIKHISTYSLIIEEDTVFHKLLQSGKDLELPKEDEERKMYYFLRDKLIKGGFNQYEISNFAIDGFESKHNLKYWSGEDYLGLGLASHSKIGNKRFENENNLSLYIEKISINEDIKKNTSLLTNLDLINEAIIMGFRLTKGFNYTDLDKKYNINFLEDYEEEINKFLNNGYIEFNNDNIKLTTLGMDFANMVELDFYRVR